MATVVEGVDGHVSRTNSLGWAKAPCQNCSKSKLSCDRARPQCATCLEKGILCAGYKLDLNWQSGIASRGNLVGFTYPTTRSPVDSGAPSAKVGRGLGGNKDRNKKQREFKFVAAKPVKKRKPRSSPTANRNDKPESLNLYNVNEPELSGYRPPSFLAAPSSPIEDDSLEIEDIITSEMTAYTRDSDTYLDLWLGANRDFLSRPADAQVQTPPLSDISLSNTELPADDPNEVLSIISASSTDRSDLLDKSISQMAFGFSTGIPPSILFSTLEQKFQDVLNRYDQYICAIPLTMDCTMNPFRIRKDTSDGSQHLLHAVLATSFYHLNRDGANTESSDLMNEHKGESLQLYSKALALSDSACTQSRLAFLDTALLLICLDSTQSAVGLYHIHLKGVRSIMELAGKEDLIISSNPKLRAQLAMFIWYDTTIALISREPTIFPLSFLESILTYGRTDGWDYVNLTGCREEFIIIMAKIARLIIQYEIARTNEYLTFDMSPVDEVEEILRDFVITPPSYQSNSSEDELNMALDKYHCDEAWRNGLILYIARFFHWRNHNNHVPSYVRFLARNTIGHARSIRKEITYQKQVLIPVFLAGAETQSEDEREFIRSYCTWWSWSCGFKQFEDVRRYLEEIWTDQELSETSDIWWATIIDRERARAGLPVHPSILLG